MVFTLSIVCLRDREVTHVKYKHTWTNDCTFALLSIILIWRWIMRVLLTIFLQPNCPPIVILNTITCTSIISLLRTDITVDYCVTCTLMQPICPRVVSNHTPCSSSLLPSISSSLPPIFLTTPTHSNSTLRPDAIAATASKGAILKPPHCIHLRTALDANPAWLLVQSRGISGTLVYRRDQRRGVFHY